MSELLLRGWNVAVPVVDVGDDVFVIDDNEKTTYRLQVKTASATPHGEGSQAGQFKLSRAQLATVLPVELFYMLLARVDTQWRFLVIPRSELWALRQRFERAPRDPVADRLCQTARRRPTASR